MAPSAIKAEFALLGPRTTVVLAGFDDGRGCRGPLLDHLVEDVAMLPSTSPARAAARPWRPTPPYPIDAARRRRRHIDCRRTESCGPCASTSCWSRTNRVRGREPSPALRWATSHTAARARAPRGRFSWPGARRRNLLSALTSSSGVDLVRRRHACASLGRRDAVHPTSCCSACVARLGAGCSCAELSRGPGCSTDWLNRAHLHSVAGIVRVVNYTNAGKGLPPLSKSSSGLPASCRTSSSAPRLAEGDRAGALRCRRACSSSTRARSLIVVCAGRGPDFAGIDAALPRARRFVWARDSRTARVLPVPPTA